MHSVILFVRKLKKKVNGDRSMVTYFYDILNVCNIMEKEHAVNDGAFFNFSWC